MCWIIPSSIKLDAHKTKVLLWSKGLVYNNIVLDWKISVQKKFLYRNFCSDIRNLFLFVTCWRVCKFKLTQEVTHARTEIHTRI